VGYEALALHPFDAISYVAGVSMPGIGALLIGVGVLIGSIAAVNSIIFSASRVSFAMGRDGNLPQAMGKLHPKKQTPATALIVSGVIIVSIIIFLPINQVAAVADILILLLFTLVNVSAITLRRKRPDVHRSFLMPWFPIVPLIGIATKMILAITLFGYEPFAWYLAIVTLFHGRP
jgi:amino acid transporter